MCVVKGIIRYILHCSLPCRVSKCINPEDATRINQNLCENEEHLLVNLTRRWQEEGDECHDDASDEERDGGQFLERML